MDVDDCVVRRLDRFFRRRALDCLGVHVCYQVLAQDLCSFAVGGAGISRELSGTGGDQVKSVTLTLDDPNANFSDFAFGDFRRLHRMGLIACYYRAAEWEHADVMNAAAK